MVGAAGAGMGAYNGVHLRIEKDAGEWARILGGLEVVRRRYREAMREARFDRNTPLYVASALLTYEGGVEELREVRARSPKLRRLSDLCCRASRNKTHALVNCGGIASLWREQGRRCPARPAQNAGWNLVYLMCFRSGSCVKLSARHNSSPHPELAL